MSSDHFKRVWASILKMDLKVSISDDILPGLFGTLSLDHILSMLESCYAMMHCNPELLFILIGT